MYLSLPKDLLSDVNFQLPLAVYCYYGFSTLTMWHIQNSKKHFFYYSYNNVALSKFFGTSGHHYQGQNLLDNTFYEQIG